MTHKDMQMPQEAGSRELETPEGWVWMYTKDIAAPVKGAMSTGPFGSSISSKYFVNVGVPVIRGGNLSDKIEITFVDKNFVFISDEKAKELDKCSVYPGDLIFTCWGTIGQVGLLPEDRNFPKYIISNKQMKLTVDRSKVCPKYIYTVFSSSLVQRQVKRKSIGSSIPGFNLGHLKSVRVHLPPLPEQKKIAQILSTWDKAITTTEQLLANSQQQKKALMQQLLTGKKRLLDQNGERFEGEWKRFELGDLLDYSQPTPYLVESTDYSDEFSTPVLTAGKTFILGYTKEALGIFSENLPVIIFDDFTTDSKFVDFPFKAKSSAMKILKAKEGVAIIYVYEAMQLLDFAVGGHQRHWISIYSRLVIPFPDREEQQKIATVLSAADQEITTLQQKLNALKQEKKALMQQLLTGKRRVVVDE